MVRWCFSVIVGCVMVVMVRVRRWLGIMCFCCCGDLICLIGVLVCISLIMLLFLLR